MQRSAFAILIVTIATLGAPVRGAEYSDAVKARISAVERSLQPDVRIKGREARWAIEERMKTRKVPAVSVAVINDYQIEWAKAYGVADAQVGSSATTETLFQAGSVSKPIAALAALRLVQEGKLDLDRNVNEQLKSWNVPDNKYTAEHAVNLRGLLSHTAGLTVHGFPGYKPSQTLPTVPEILDGTKPANTAPVRVNKVPGNGFRYAGGGTTVAQLLVMDVTGEPYADFVQGSVLAPLGMTSSSYQQPIGKTLKLKTAAAHAAAGTVVDERVRVHPEQAAAGLWTTPSDVARYVIEVQLAHEGRSAKVLSKEMVEQMLTPQGGGPVGLGPFLHDSDGVRWFAHGGQNLGFSCQFIGYLDRGQGAVVMTNSDIGAPLFTEVLNAIASVYEWPGYLQPDREVVDLPETTLDRYAGKYDYGAAGSVTVRREGTHLFAKASLRRLEAELFLSSPSEFFSDTPGIAGRFVTEGDGPASELILTTPARDSRLKRMAD